MLFPFDFLFHRLELLKLEQADLGIKKSDTRMGAKFQQLHKYADIQGSSVLKAKLCLLILSLPAYEICKIPMQDAAKVGGNYAFESKFDKIRFTKLLSLYIKGTNFGEN